MLVIIGKFPVNPIISRTIAFISLFVFLVYLIFIVVIVQKIRVKMTVKIFK